MDKVTIRKKWLESKVSELSLKLDELYRKTEELMDLDEEIGRVSTEVSRYRSSLANIMLIEMGYSIGSEVLVTSWDGTENKVTITGGLLHVIYGLTVDFVNENGEMSSVSVEKMRRVE